MIVRQFRGMCIFIAPKLVWNAGLIKYKTEWLNIMVNNDDVGYFKGQDNKCLFINTMSDDFFPQKIKFSV